MNSMKKLYSATSKLKDFVVRGNVYEELPILWHYYDRKKPVIPYEVAIDVYTPDGMLNQYCESCLDGFFTYEEVQMLCSDKSDLRILIIVISGSNS